MHNIGTIPQAYCDVVTPALGIEHDRRRWRMKGVRNGAVVDRCRGDLSPMTDVGYHNEAAKPRMPQAYCDNCFNNFITK